MSSNQLNVKNNSDNKIDLLSYTFMLPLQIQ